MTMTTWICATCGVAYPPAATAPERCPICEDSRQYVGANGQEWTTMDRLRGTHRNEMREEEPGLSSIHTEPGFGQRAFLIETGDGNVLWDCITLLDDETIAWVRQRGGIRAMAISHPHYYSSMRAWSEAFGDCPIWIHADDRKWVVSQAPQVTWWSGEMEPLFGGLTLVRCGGHFDGYQVLHWPAGAGGTGALFAGDQPQVCMDRRWVTFMYSYPNMIPFDAATVRRITDTLEPLAFTRLYGAFGRHVMDEAKPVIARSRARYLRAIGADLDAIEESQR
jgi:glyoxylase-like metal-dependent hydrolase (beta-lactamase superfamily II)